jgi:hypothetical protein
MELGQEVYFNFTDPDLWAWDVLRVPMDLVTDSVVLANYAESSVTPLLVRRPS